MRKEKKETFLKQPLCGIFLLKKRYLLKNEFKKMKKIRKKMNDNKKKINK